MRCSLFVCYQSLCTAEAKLAKYALAVMPQMRLCEFGAGPGLSENVGCAKSGRSGHQGQWVAVRKTTTGALQNDLPARLIRYRNPT